VTLVPWLQDTVPSNVVRAVNYYQSPGWGSPLTGDPDFKGELSNINVASDAGAFHINIDKDPKIQTQIVSSSLASPWWDGTGSRLLQLCARASDSACCQLPPPLFSASPHIPPSREAPPCPSGKTTRFGRPPCPLPKCNPGSILRPSPKSPSGRRPLSR